LHVWITFLLGAGAAGWW